MWLHCLVKLVPSSHCYTKVQVYNLDTIGPGEAGCHRQVAGCHRQVTSLYSDHYRQVQLYMILLDLGRLGAVDSWLPCTVTTTSHLLI